MNPYQVNLERSMYSVDGLSAKYNHLVEMASAHLYITIAVVVAITLLFVYWYKPFEGFMPGATMKMQVLDDTGREHLAAAPAQGRAASVFAQTVQDPASVAVSSTSAQVLQSADFACSTRTPVTSDAWSWMSGVAAAPDTSAESMRGVKTDAQLSAIMAGH